MTIFTSRGGFTWQRRHRKWKKRLDKAWPWEQLPKRDKVPLGMNFDHVHLINERRSGRKKFTFSFYDNDGRSHYKLLMRPRR